MEEILSAIQLDTNIVLLLLYLPIVATLVAFARHIIGLRSVGIFITIVVTFMLYQFGTTPGTVGSNTLDGFKYGVSIILIVFISATVTYGLIKDWALHYYPKLAIVLTMVVLSILSLLIISARFELDGFLQLNIFSLIMTALLSERIMNLLARKSLRTTSLIMLESFTISSFTYIAVSWIEFQNLIINYPYLVLLIIPINYFLGRFNGLRLREYYRFRDILKGDE